MLRTLRSLPRLSCFSTVLKTFRRFYRSPPGTNSTNLRYNSEYRELPYYEWWSPRQMNYPDFPRKDDAERVGKLPWDTSERGKSKQSMAMKQILLEANKHPQLLRHLLKEQRENEGYFRHLMRSRIDAREAAHSGLQIEHELMYEFARQKVLNAPEECVEDSFEEVAEEEEEDEPLPDYSEDDQGPEDPLKRPRLENLQRPQNEKKILDQNTEDCQHHKVENDAIGTNGEKARSNDDENEVKTEVKQRDEDDENQDDQLTSVNQNDELEENDDDLDDEQVEKIVSEQIKDVFPRLIRDPQEFDRILYLRDELRPFLDALLEADKVMTKKLKEELLIDWQSEGYLDLDSIKDEKCKEFYDQWITDEIEASAVEMKMRKGKRAKIDARIWETFAQFEELKMIGYDIDVEEMKLKEEIQKLRDEGISEEEIAKQLNDKRKQPFELHDIQPIDVDEVIKGKRPFTSDVKNQESSELDAC